MLKSIFELFPTTGFGNTLFQRYLTIFIYLLSVNFSLVRRAKHILLVLEHRLYKLYELVLSLYSRLYLNYHHIHFNYQSFLKTGKHQLFQSYFKSACSFRGKAVPHIPLHKYTLKVQIIILLLYCLSQPKKRDKAIPEFLIHK